VQGTSEKKTRRGKKIKKVQGEGHKGKRGVEESKRKTNVNGSRVRIDRKGKVEDTRNKNSIEKKGLRKKNIFSNLHPHILCITLRRYVVHAKRGERLEAMVLLSSSLYSLSLFSLSSPK